MCYNELEEFFLHCKSVVDVDSSFMHDGWLPTKAAGLQDASFPRSMKTFFLAFGDHIMVLWKLALLKCRVLIAVRPPIALSCHYNYYIASMTVNDVLTGVINKPLFFTCLTDIQRLQEETAYVACATDTIFETKSHLYDVYVDGTTFKTKSQHLVPLLTPNRADRRKLNVLKKVMLQHTSEKDAFMNFFTSMNNGLFEMLFKLANYSLSVTPDLMLQMGLDPSLDRGFLGLLIEAHGFDINVPTKDNICCVKV